MTTHINKLTRNTVEALERIDNEHIEMELGRTTADFNTSPTEALAWLNAEMAKLPGGRGGDRHTLHAVRRRLVALADAEPEHIDIVEDAELVGPIAVEDGDFRPKPGEQFQVMRGYQHDDTIFKVREYAPITSPPEKIQEAYQLPELPTEVVHASRLERHNRTWVATTRHTFPTAILVPVGSTTKAFSEANGGASKPRVRKAKAGASTTGNRCEHCGEPTKGGRFIPGHDAKLKGDLIREATDEATAERVVRGWLSSGWDDKAGKVAKLVAKDGFLQARIEARIGKAES